MSGRIVDAFRAWPCSEPSYKWPAHLTAPGMQPVRLAMAGIFYAAYGIGRLVGVFDRDTSRVLVIRTDGLGDALLFEPAMESLARQASPKSLHLWAPRLTCQLLANCPSLQRLVVVPRGFKQGNLSYFTSPIWRARLGFALGRWRFDRVVYPVESPEPLGNWLFTSAQATERWINAGDTSNQFDGQQTETHKLATWIIEARPGNAHELHRNEYLASQWANERSLRRPKVHLDDADQISADAQAEAWRTAARREGAAEIVGVVPAASMLVKAYPQACWLAAIKQLWIQDHAMCALLAGPGDTPTLDRLATELARQEVPVLRLPRPLGILQMAAIVGKLDGMLSVDTGLAHLAVAQQVPTVVLVGGGNPGRFFPWPNAKHHIALNVPTPCAGCSNRCTEAEPICITHITADEVVGAYMQLKGRSAPPQVYAEAG